MPEKRRDVCIARVGVWGVVVAQWPAISLKDGWSPIKIGKAPQCRELSLMMRVKELWGVRLLLASYEQKIGLGLGGRLIADR